MEVGDLISRIPQCQHPIQWVYTRPGDMDDFDMRAAGIMWMWRAGKYVEREGALVVELFQSDIPDVEVVTLLLNNGRITPGVQIHPISEWVVLGDVTEWVESVNGKQ